MGKEEYGTGLMVSGIELREGGTCGEKTGGGGGGRKMARCGVHCFLFRGGAGLSRLRCNPDI